MSKQRNYFVQLFIAVDGRQLADIVEGNGNSYIAAVHKKHMTVVSAFHFLFFPLYVELYHRARNMEYTTFHSILLASWTQMKFVRLLLSPLHACLQYLYLYNVDVEVHCRMYVYIASSCETL